MPLFGVDNVHELSTDRAAVGALKILTDLTQCRLRSAEIDGTHLKGRVEVGVAELMKRQR